MEGLMERLERAVTRLEKMSVTMQAASGITNGDCVNGIDGGLSQCVEAFDVLLTGPASEYLSYSRALGSEVEKHAEMVNNALQTQRTFLNMAATHQEPAKEVITPYLSGHWLRGGEKSVQRLSEKQTRKEYGFYREREGLTPEI